jgi:hypothetical protein
LSQPCRPSEKGTTAVTKSTPDGHQFAPQHQPVVEKGSRSVTGRADHPHVEPSSHPLLDQHGLESLSDDDLEAELTIAAYAPGRVRWERYQRLLRERLRRRLIAA